MIQLVEHLAVVHNCTLHIAAKWVAASGAGFCTYAAECHLQTSHDQDPAGDTYTANGWHLLSVWAVGAVGFCAVKILVGHGAQ